MMFLHDVTCALSHCIEIMLLLISNLRTQARTCSCREPQTPAVGKLLDEMKCAFLF